MNKFINLKKWGRLLMNKKLIAAAAVSLLIFSAGSVKAASLQVKRLCGNNRFKTCSEIVNEGWKSSNFAVIVNGLNFPDAISASTLAKKYNAPILLTKGDKLDADAYFQINRLNVRKVFIVGGDGVISPVIEDQLRAMKVKSERYYGSNRTDTSIAVAGQIGTSNGIILTTDSDYTDALSVAPIASKYQMPIILMPKNTVPYSVSNFIRGRNIPKTYILGGQDLISNAVAAKFPNVKRINGSNKYERNINIINAFSDKFKFQSSFLAYSEGFADALSSSALASLTASPIILVGDKAAPITKKFVSNKSFNKMYVIGGTGVIKESTLSSFMQPGTQDKPSADEEDNGKKIIPISTDAASHSDLQKSLYNYLTDKDNRQSVLERAIQLHNGVTSNNCVYYASEALRRAGMTDLPTWVCNTNQLTEQLQKRGWVKNTDLSQIRPGDICFTTNGPSHTYTFMKWKSLDSCDYAYVCDNQGNEYGGDAYHERNVSIPKPTKDATAYFMYLPQNKISV